MKVGKIILIQ